jgi:trans-aconitate methyltransferase
VSQVWQELAPAYRELRDDTRRTFLFPAILALLPPDPAAHVVDFGCGCGDLSLILAKRFARVAAYDPAPAMVELARGAGAGLSQLQVTGNLGELAPASADAVVLSLVLQTLPGADAVREVLRQARRSLRPEGRLVVGMTHPCFTLPVIEAGHYASQDAPYEVTLAGPSGTISFTDFHRPLDAWLNLLADAGWSITRSREVFDTAEYYRQRGEPVPRFAGQLPLFLVLALGPASISANRPAPRQP